MKDFSELTGDSDGAQTRCLPARAQDDYAGGADPRCVVRPVPGKRKGDNNQRYVIGEAGLSAFSVFFMQSTSFLDDQSRMQKERGLNNASSLFGVHQIPCTQHICNLLDPISPDHLAPAFLDIVEPLVQGGELEQHRRFAGRLLVGLDGTQYHDSESIYCLWGRLGLPCCVRIPILKSVGPAFPPAVRYQCGENFRFLDLTAYLLVHAVRLPAYQVEATVSRALRTPGLPPTHGPVGYRWQNIGSFISLINTRATSVSH